MLKTTKFKLILILIVVSFFAYASSLGNPFIWDDEQFITSNVYVQQFDISKIFTTSTTAGAGVVSNYYRPLTTLSFAIDTKIWGENSFGFHLSNLFFHISAGVLLFLLLLEAGIGEWGSFFTSLFFLIHPVQTEAVTYINSRGDSLYTAFLFGSLVLFVMSLRGVQRRSNLNNSGIAALPLVARNDGMLLVGAILLYILSVLSKETAIAAFPLFFVLIVIHVFKNRQNFAQSMQLYAKPIFVAILAGLIGAGYFVLRLTVLNFENTLNYYGAPTFYASHIWVRLFTFAKVLWIYLGILIWPYPLHMERSVSLVSSFFSWEVLGGLLLIGGLLGLAIWEIRKKHTGNILFGLALSVCLLIPVSGIIPINGLLYEHWLYVPMVGFFVMVYGVWKIIQSSLRGVQRRSNHTKDQIGALPLVTRNDTRKLLFSFALLLSILYIVLTIRQNNIWSDPITFYRYTLSFAPDSARLYNNLGMSLGDIGDYKGAIKEYKRALAEGSEYPQIYNNLGNTEIKISDYKDAEKNLKKALQLSPNFATAKLNLFKLYLITKQINKAQELAKSDSYLMGLYLRYIHVVQDNK